MKLTFSPENGWIYDQKLSDGLAAVHEEALKCANVASYQLRKARSGKFELKKVTLKN